MKTVEYKAELLVDIDSKKDWSSKLVTETAWVIKVQVPSRPDENIQQRNNDKRRMVQTKQIAIESKEVDINSQTVSIIDP